MNDLLWKMLGTAAALRDDWKNCGDISWIDVNNMENHPPHPVTGLSTWQTLAKRQEIKTWMDNFIKEQQTILNLNSENCNYLFSPGSAASRSIRIHYSLNIMPYCATGLHQGHMGHIRDPSFVWNINTSRSIYIASHPIETVISHYLRNIITQGDGAIMCGGRDAENYEFIYEINGDEKHAGMSKTLEQNINDINWFFDRYIDFGCDFFRLSETIAAWNKSPNVYALKYENFKKEEKKINKWLNKPSNYKELPWKKRVSKREYLSSSNLSRLKKMYEQAICEYEKLGQNNAV